MLTSRTPRPVALVAALVLTLALGGCKIVYDSEKTANDPADPNSFDAKTYVGAFWERKALTFFDEHATALPVVLAALAKDTAAAGKKYGHRAGGEGSPWTFAVRGSGVVQTISTASHHGEITINVGPAGHPVTATFQIGPVIYGTAVRDSLPFIAFGDFVNQIQYAEISRALNDRASALARSTLAPPPHAGSRVDFVGAMADPATTDGPTITAIRLRPAAGAK